MCLEVKTCIHNKLVKRFAKTGYITAWKIFRIHWLDGANKKYLGSQYRSTQVKSAGWMKSNRRIKGRTALLKRIYDGHEVSLGIHVYLDRSNANYDSDCSWSPTVVVPVKCLAKDLVAGGSFFGASSAVFSKVFISRKDMNKALKVHR